jgi:hypothetical protein
MRLTFSVPLLLPATAAAAFAVLPPQGSLNNAAAGSTRNIRRSLGSATLTHLSAKPKVFIDGEAGTTGLQVRDRLAKRDDIEIISAPDDLRKDEATRKALINEADAVILCTCCVRAFRFVLFSCG